MTQQQKRPRLLILGAGSEAAWVLDILAAMGDPYDIVGLVELSEKHAARGTALEGHKVLGTIDELLSIAENNTDYYIAASRDNRGRADATRRAEVCGIFPVRLAHPRATVAHSARIEPGAILHPGCVLGPRAVVRAGCIIDTHASVDGFSAVGPFAHLDVGCHIGGRCEVGPYVTVGAGAIVLPRVQIGQGAVVAPGSVVTRPVEDYCIVGGQPARVLDRLPVPKDGSGTSLYESSGTREISGRRPSTSRVDHSLADDVRSATSGDDAPARPGDSQAPRAGPGISSDAGTRF